MTITITLMGILSTIGLLTIIFILGWIGYGFTVLTFIGEPEPWWLVIYGVIMVLLVISMVGLIWMVVI